MTGSKKIVSSGPDSATSKSNRRKVVAKKRKYISHVRNKRFAKLKKIKIAANKKQNSTRKNSQKMPEKEVFKTFNHSWVQKHFKKKLFRKAYKHFIDYVFADKTMDELNDILLINCSINFDSIWGKLYKFCLTEMVSCDLAGIPTECVLTEINCLGYDLSGNDKLSTNKLDSPVIQGSDIDLSTPHSPENYQADLFPFKPLSPVIDFNTFYTHKLDSPVFDSGIYPTMFDDLDDIESVSEQLRNFNN